MGPGVLPSNGVLGGSGGALCVGGNGGAGPGLGGGVVLTYCPAVASGGGTLNGVVEGGDTARGTGGAGAAGGAGGAGDRAGGGGEAEPAELAGKRTDPLDGGSGGGGPLRDIVEFPVTCGLKEPFLNAGGGGGPDGGGPGGGGGAPSDGCDGGAAGGGGGGAFVLLSTLLGELGASISWTTPFPFVIPRCCLFACSFFSFSAI